MTYAQKIKDYIYNLENGNFLGNKILKLKINCLSSTEPRRVFLLDINSDNYVLKINENTHWDKRNRTINEYEALMLLKSYGIKNIPQVYYFDKNKFDGKETLIISFIRNNSYQKLKTEHINKLVDLLIKIHSNKSNYFTIPFGNFKRHYKGNGLDFIYSYFFIIRKYFKYFSKKYKGANATRICNKFLNFIENKIYKEKEIFKHNDDFYLLHGHLTNTRNHRHILVQDKNISIVDWESACFGEREYEIASFLYENYELNFQKKMFFLKCYLDKNTLNLRKIKIYRFLIELDNFGEVMGFFLVKNQVTNKSKSINLERNKYFIEHLISLKKQMLSC